MRLPSAAAVLAAALLAGASSATATEPAAVPEPTRAELVSADASLDVVRDVCSRCLDALLAELRARYPRIDARRSAGRSKKNDYRNYQWISVKSGGREYLLATHHGNLDVRTGNPHTQFGRIQFWRCAGPNGPHTRDESGVWRFRADNEDATLPPTHVWDEDFSSAAVVDRFVAFLERSGEGPVLSALANQSSVAPAVPAGTMAAGTAAATEDFATTGTDSGPSPSRRDGAAPSLRGLPSEARLGESPRSADPPLSERRRADEALENVRAVEAKAMAAIVAELRRRHPEWKVRTSRGNSRVNDYRCYQWITVRVAEDDVRWITLVFNDQDPATGNTHSQFGRIQFWSGVDHHNGPQNEAGPHTRDTGGWRFRSDKQWADMPRLHLWSPEYSSAHVVDLFETFVGR